MNYLFWKLLSNFLQNKMSFYFFHVYAIIKITFQFGNERHASWMFIVSLVLSLLAFFFLCGVIPMQAESGAWTQMILFLCPLSHTRFLN